MSSFLRDRGTELYQIFGQHTTLVDAA